MKAKTVITTILIVMLLVPVMSQTRKIRTGNRYYSKYNYSQAVKYYSSAKEKSLEVDRKLAHSYVMLGSHAQAQEVYERILQQPGRDFEDVWQYYMVLQRQGDYDKARTQIPLLSDLRPEDSRVRLHRQAGEYYKELLEGKATFELRSLGMNSRQQDFAPVIYRGRVVYASSRVPAGFARRIWSGNHLNYLNLYTSEIDGNNDFGRGKSFDRKLNRKFHDGPASFDASGNLMAITRNNYQGRSSDGTRNLQLFISEYVDGGWTTPVAFPYNNAEYSIGQASLTPDGRYMYFVSDMPGGAGGTDLYRIERRSDGSWGRMENLWSINTEGNEMFPVYHPDGLLFFSSDGHPGLGGLDMFVSVVTGENYGKPKNLGIPINSTGEDFALVLDKDQKFGYLSSIREGGRGSDDIYAVNVLEPLKQGKKIRGVTKDDEDNIISNAEVQLQFGGRITDRVESDARGRYEFSVDELGLYYLTGEKPGYEEGQNTANTDVPEDVVYADLILKKSVPFSLKLIVMDSKTGVRLGNVRISMKDNLSGEEQVVYTTTRGEYAAELDKKLNDRISYTMTFDKSGYVTSTSTYEQILAREGEYEYIIRLDPLEQELIVGDDLGKKFQINPIYFDFDKSNIRPDAAMELDKIVQIMNEYPTMVIELGSHTDCRGSFSYNTALSDRRAKSSAEYVRDRITNPERIYGKGYGESKLVNNCACEGTRESNCTEEEHQLNRRTEFVIVGYDEKHRETRNKGKYFGTKPPVPDESMSATKAGWYIIGGSFKKKQSAEELLQIIKSEGYQQAEIIRDQKTNMYRVSYRWFDNKEQAENELARIKAAAKNGKDIWLYKE
jgi:outer membrane protein OmpA-like peptidoglycan-associated protein